MAFTARTETYFDASTLTTPFNFALDKPTDTAAGNILFVFISWRDFSGFVIDAVPDGWTLAAENTDDNHKFALYYKVAGASEPSSYTWSLSGTAVIRATCSCYTGGDFNAADPIDVISNTDYEEADTTVRAASMSVSAANSPMVFFAAGYYYLGTLTFTKPSVPTTDWVEDDDAGSATSDWWHEVCSMIWSGSGATGNMDATASATPYTNAKHAFAVALKPAPAAVVPFRNYYPHILAH